MSCPTCEAMRQEMNIMRVEQKRDTEIIENLMNGMSMTAAEAVTATCIFMALGICVEALDKEANPDAMSAFNAAREKRTNMTEDEARSVLGAMKDMAPTSLSIILQNKELAQKVFPKAVFDLLVWGEDKGQSKIITLD